MNRFRITRRRATIAAAAVLAIAASAGTAAALTLTSGAAQVSMDNVSETQATLVNSTVWTNVPGAAAPVNVPPGATRLVNARFTAETSCQGPFGFCSVRIIADNGTSIIELDPNDGADFAFDSSPGGGVDDLWEGNAMERSRRLPAGYRVRVQAKGSVPGLAFRIDDWHFTVELSA